MFDFNILLAVISAIFPHSDTLFQILQSKSVNIVYYTEKNDNFKLILQQFRETFDSLWKGIAKMTPSSYSVKRNGKGPSVYRNNRCDSYGRKRSIL
jgi:hypothetical protein